MKRRLGVLITLIMIFVLMLSLYWNEIRGIINKNKINQENWVGIWTASMQAPLDDGTSHKEFNNQTIRMIVHPHVDGKKVRLRVSNTFSNEPLAIEEVHVAISKNAADIEPDTDHQVKFGGKSTVTIPPGERKYSDSISIEMSGNKGLAVSLYVKGKSGPVTWHPVSMQTTYISGGNDVSNSDSSAFNKREEAWFWLDGVDIIADPSVKGSVVVMGSSIANGNHSTVNANHRWTDYLAKRLKQENTGMTVLNAGISANHLINNPPENGDNALARLERDVFNQSGVKSLILHQGLNDIRHHPEYDADKIIERMKQIIDSTHDQGLTIYGGTLTPFKGSGMFTSQGEETRQEVNHWIRTSGEFDGVIDFDKAMRNPDEPSRYLTKYDSGDHLHPNDAGYKRMAETVDLSLFK
ncbi:SGNH/GDSL hydrolase family protein [Bacillus sp. BHET2]|uniref:SGNH/GDSL hydrolase family protein n=1 Tax=Bacillus sp. BHET2 TaxID=2583818 RepID=UPI00110E46F3|nr:SGNH/GDSL hydrolase family protein [Bacillus sp. BHET2]TMU83471.1 SGNH/GDSL hydrolase family protein [Bacillus sp. BHET2]